jgi:magnesium-transporting ATPase (P-type)
LLLLRVAGCWLLVGKKPVTCNPQPATQMKPQTLIPRSCLTQIIHTFTIAFFAFHAVFEVMIMILSNRTSGLTSEVLIPGFSLHASFFIYSIAGVVLYLLSITGIILILKAKRLGIYLLYISVGLLIIYYLVKNEPDWWSALIIAVIVICYAIFLHLIHFHSKLQDESSGDSNN